MINFEILQIEEPDDKNFYNAKYFTDASGVVLIVDQIILARDLSRIIFAT